MLVFLQKGKKRCLYFHIFVLVCTFRNKDFHHFLFHLWSFWQVWLFSVTSCFWEELSGSSCATAARFCSWTRNSRASGSHRCSSAAGTRWWCHNHRDHFLCNTRHRRCCVWEAGHAQPDTVSPVLVQIPPQVPDGFPEAHFQYEHAVPVFWLYLQGEEVGAGGLHPVKRFHWVCCFFKRTFSNVFALFWSQSILALEMLICHFQLAFLGKLHSMKS